MGVFHQNAGLSLIFMAAADILMAGGLGMIGLHGFVVDAGASLGEAFNVPQVDWLGLSEGEFSFLDPETDDCLAAGGHYHGSDCHIPEDIPSAERPPLTFED